MKMRTQVILFCFMFTKVGTFLADNLSVEDVAALWQQDQDLLLGCQGVKEQFNTDTQLLINLEDAFNGVKTALVALAQARNTSLIQYEQQIINYQSLLAEEEKNLIALQDQGVLAKSALQDQIEQVATQSTDEITQLQDLINRTKQAIAELQEDLATITNMNQDSVMGVKDMLQSYNQFTTVRSNFKEQVDQLVAQVNAYTSGTLAGTDQ